MMRVKCNHCGSEFDEEYIVDNDGECCPVCRLSGGLMDLFDPDDFDATTRKGQAYHMALMVSYELSEALEKALNSQDDISIESEVRARLDSITSWVADDNRGGSMTARGQALELIGRSVAISASVERIACELRATCQPQWMKPYLDELDRIKEYASDTQIMVADLTQMLSDKEEEQ